jgi:CubicO group peptidase (beta-lactamase class C family)
MRKNIYPTGKPEDYSVSTEAIQQTIDFIRKENNLELHSFLLLRRGTLLWEEYFRPDEANSLHVQYSVSKSFAATAIGLTQDEGLLYVEDKLSSFFPEHAHLFESDDKKELNLHHLLIMGSGYKNTEQELFSQYSLVGDLTKAALDVPLIHKPGEVFDYNSLGSYLFTSAFSKVVPEGIHSYLKRKLFKQLDINTSVWNVDSMGIPFGGFGLYLTAYDMTKLGQLYLQEGNWQGQQLLSKSFVKTATSKQISNCNQDDDKNINWRSGYGYQFWRNSFGGYRGDGMKGQFIVVLPEQELVVVMTGNYDEMDIPLISIENNLLPHVI